MNKVSSKRKGDLFEEKIYNLVKKQIEENSFLANKIFCKVFRQKAYYSRDRQDNIIVDISVEVTYPNSDKYSLLFVFECKDYKAKVSIDNIEEFAMKLSQIAGYNVKGIMVTTSGYSLNGLNLASSKGIGLARAVENEIIYDVYRISNFCQQYSVRELLCNDINQIPFCIYDSKIFYSIGEYFKYLGIIEKVVNVSNLTIPYLENDTIKKRAEDILKKYVPDVFQIIQPTPLDDICSKLGKKKSIQFIYDKDLGYHNGYEILGRLISNRIYVSSKLDKDIHRFRFTLAHELGHYILHSKYLTEDNIDTIKDLNVEVNNDVLKRMELQANYFASCLLMPDLSFYALVMQRFLYDKIKGRVLILDDQYCNVNTFYRVTNEISRYFNVSKESAKYKLQALGLLINKSSVHQIRDFL